MIARLPTTVIFCTLLQLQPASAENLHDIFELARLNDPRILAADYERQAAELDVPIARSARRPRLNLFVDSDYEYDSSLGRDNEEGRLESGLTLTMPLYNRRNNVGIDIAQTAVDEAFIGFQFQEQSLFLRTADLYFEVLKSADNVRFSEAGLDAIKKQVNLAVELDSERLIPRSDVKEAQASMESANATVIDAKNSHAAAREALKVATGQYPGALSAIRENVTLASPVPDDAEHWVNLALTGNPSLRLARSQLQRAELEVDFARSARYPTLDLQSSYRHTNSDRESNDNEAVGDVAVRFNLPLYQGGGIQARTAQARLRKDLANQQMLFAERGVEEQVRNAFASINASIGRANALERAVQSNEASLQGIQAGVVEQTRTIVDLLDATSRLTQANVEFSAARYDYLLNLLALKSFAGELTSDDLSSVDEWLEN